MKRACRRLPDSWRLVVQEVLEAVVVGGCDNILGRVRLRCRQKSCAAAGVVAGDTRIDVGNHVYYY